MGVFLRTCWDCIGIADNKKPFIYKGFGSLWDFMGLSYGANERIRTADLLITNEPLYQLSYIGFIESLHPCVRVVGNQGRGSIRNYER